ncbi:DNA-nicking Smr family endonuclease [Rhodobacter aestuarii]|uniref:DNA-nicking endonuclease, Smr domain n=1 Tax=Rhodobacter aestuarii TaxID=453582 RepID=A0A1N7LHN2_9RHOB|nr:MULTISPECIES: Smr/MutS family protein [Rhodobacter]PTV95246.1 DNA-nicking Smr family endonuclease [Rhodobacter aestuarii]SIS73348.1 DNA-nicking endonuclease, Smr domain [Rhodobacter aestuarii]SOC08012.1 DNA-nicking Smr family endonuclease [Rhodobacter sp. JA431]
MKRRRLLSAEEREVWEKVAATTHSMHKRAPISAETEPEPAEKHGHHPPKKPRFEMKDFQIGPSAPDLGWRVDMAPSLSEQLHRQPVVMDRKTHRNMTRGKLEPEAKIDLHGMTMAQAHPALIRFVMQSRDRDCRLILVITGKGKRGLDDGPIPQRQGVLRHQVPQWLRLPPLGTVVMQVTEAHLKHGGSGAYYVYLRRTR